MALIRGSCLVTGLQHLFICAMCTALTNIALEDKLAL